MVKNTIKPILAAMLLASAAGPLGAAEVSIEGYDLTVVADDGTRLKGPDLTGVELVVADENANDLHIRIEGAEAASWDASKWLFTLSVKDKATGEWHGFCDTGPQGKSLGMPLAGTLTPDGRFEPSQTQITFSCTAGALAKCIRFGYSPWDSAEDGTPLTDHYQACMRMVRADYCGTGTPHTRDGTPINIFDRLGIQVADDAPGFTFEAAWGPDGAICVAHTRWAPDFSMQDLGAACGQKFSAQPASDCTFENSQSHPDALLFNESIERGAAE